MMAMLPLRSSMVFAQTTCEMHDQASQLVEDYSMHMMHLMAEDTQIDNGESQNSDCCDSDITCTSDCGMGMSVSFIIQSAVTLPALNKAAFNALVNNNLVLRDLAPPIRPPTNL